MLMLPRSSQTHVVVVVSSCRRESAKRNRDHDCSVTAKTVEEIA